MTIGEILAFPVMKDEYDNYQNGEDSGTGLVRFLGFFAATVIGILFCIVLTVFTIRDALGGSEGGRREKLGGRGAGAAWAVGERSGQPWGFGRGGREEQGAGGAAERVDGVAACGGEVRGALPGASGNAGDAEVCGGAVFGRICD